MSTIIVGAGPSLGAAVARRFGGEGMAVGLVSRDRTKLEALAGALRDEGLTVDVEPADIRDAAALDAAIRALAERLGPVAVLEYSPLPAKDSGGSTWSGSRFRRGWGSTTSVGRGVAARRRARGGRFGAGSGVRR